MRIRRSASKLLGSGMVRPPSPPQSLPWPSSELGTTAGECSAKVLCDLNQSPWDDLAPDLYLTNPQKAETTEEEKDPILFSSQPISEASCVKEMKEKMARCKRRNGKAWQCKRLARPPNTLCDYHIHQSRSYHTPNNNGAVKSDANLVTLRQNKKKNKEQEKKNDKKRKKVADDGVDYYYYYSGFGPRLGKSRGQRSYSVINGVEEEEEEEEEEEGEKKNTDGYRKRNRKPMKCRSLKSLM